MSQIAQHMPFTQSLILFNITLSLADSNILASTLPSKSQYFPNISNFSLNNHNSEPEKPYLPLINNNPTTFNSTRIEIDVELPIGSTYHLVNAYLMTFRAKDGIIKPKIMKTEFQALIENKTWVLVAFDNLVKL